MVARLAIVLVVGLLVACGGPTAALPSSSPTLRSYPATEPSPSLVAQPGVPVRLRIPALKIDSPIMVVGLMSDGSVGTPCDPTKPWAPCNTNATAWYKGSARPGAPGNAVLDGHTDWFGPFGSGTDVPAVFAKLYRIRLGDKVLVTDKKGVSRTFVVDRISTLPYPKQPVGTYDLSGPSTLTLITCIGVYVNTSTGMDHRLYVHGTMLP